MDIYERLTQDHQSQKKLASQIMETSGDSAERQRLFDEFRTETEAHANAEEQTFYAALIEQPEGQEKARHSIAEHKEAADQLTELNEQDMSSSGWIRNFEKLKDELEHHIEEEEIEVFQLAKSLLENGLTLKMAEEFDNRKQAELKS